MACHTAFWNAASATFLLRPKPTDDLPKLAKKRPTSPTRGGPLTQIASAIAIYLRAKRPQQQQNSTGFACGCFTYLLPVCQQLPGIYYTLEGSDETNCWLYQRRQSLSLGRRLFAVGKCCSVKQRLALPKTHRTTRGPFSSPTAVAAAVP